MSDKGLFKDSRLYVIFSITLIAVMGVASLTPALPKIKDTLHLTQSQTGLLISVFTLPGIILTPLAGILADRYGRKIIVIPSLFLFGIAGFAIYFVHTFHYILLFRIIQGVGASSIGALNTTLIGDFYKGPDRPAVMGYNASVLSLSTAIYPLIGGALAGIAWNFPFVLPLLALPVGFFALYGMPEPEVEKTEDFKSYLKNISKSIVKKEVIAIFTLSTITFIILYGAFLTFMPFLLHQQFGFSAPQIGMMFSVSSFTMAIISTRVGKLTIKYGSLSLLRAAFLLYFLATLLMPHILNVYVFLLPIFLYGTAQALNVPSLQTSLANLAPDNLRGAFMSLNGMVLRIGQTLGPLIIGIGYSVNGLAGAYYTAAGFALLGLLILFTLTKK